MLLRATFYRFYKQDHHIYFLGNNCFYCHKGKDFNLNKKGKYFVEKNNQMKLIFGKNQEKIYNVQ